MFASTKQYILTIIFALFAILSVIAPAEAVAAGNVLCGLFLAALAIFVVFTFIGWYSQKGQGSSSNVEDEAE
jgi:hypothetical protein